jgi:hypothetical protein
MKPLLKKDIDGFLKRFDGFVNSELRSMQIISSSAVKITLAVQDAARDFDWVTISLEFNGISDAKLPQNSNLNFIDMSEGITLTTLENEFVFAIGEYNASNISDSICYIKSSSIKYLQSAY